MELLKGEPLDVWMERKFEHFQREKSKNYNFQNEIIEILVPILEALIAAHSVNPPVIHRDIVWEIRRFLGENFIYCLETWKYFFDISHFFTPKMHSSTFGFWSCDFGWSEITKKYNKPRYSSVCALILRNRVLSFRRYASPEQTQFGGRIDIKSDLWSVGESFPAWNSLMKILIFWNFCTEIRL